MKIWNRDTSHNHNRSSCRRVQTKLLEYLEDQLPVAEQNSIAAHLNHCPRCAAERMTLQNTMKLLSHRVLQEPDETFWMDLRYRIRQALPEKKVVSIYRPPVPARTWGPAVVAASVLVFMFLWWAGHPFPPVSDSGSLLSRLELEGSHSLRQLGQRADETVDHLSSSSPGDSLADLLATIPHPRETLQRALLKGKMVEDPFLWESVIEEETFSETPLDVLLDALTEDQLRILSIRLDHLLG